MKHEKYTIVRKRSSGMRLSIILSLLLTTSLFTSCGDDELDIPDIPLAGRINGQEWEYQYGNNSPYSGSSGGTKYKLILLSTEETSSNPCGVLGSTRPYLSVVLPLAQGSYSLPILPDQENLKFVYGNGVELSAASGFIEILAVDLENQFRMAGYIQAILDDDNMVEGTFVLDIC